MIVTVLYRAAGEPAVEATASFADVAADAYYYNAVLWAQANGIVNGYDDTTFAPNDNITREQLAAILWRYAGSPSSAYELSFADASDISSYAVEAFAWAVENGIMSGVDATTIAPKALATRAQFAKMLNVYLESAKEEAVEETVEEEVAEEAATEEVAEEATEETAEEVVEEVAAE